MRVWRLVLTLLLMVAVPSYGMGAGGRHEDGCSAQAHVAGLDVPAMSDALPCCGGTGSHHPGDACARLCTLGGDCRSANVVQAVLAHSPDVVLITRVSSPSYVPVAGLDPSRVWRPPRTL